jgi:GNAT superfamily N-acetyltransferase
MDIIEQNLFVRMHRPNLTNIPVYSLPPEYSIRWYSSGDIKHWVAIHESAERYAEVTGKVHAENFGSDVDVLHERQCFLLDRHKRPIATATAWSDDEYDGRISGRVHWVAVVPEYQGRGLSKPLLSIVLRRMIELGDDRAYLRTSTARLPAVNLYAAFGFFPSLRTPEDYAAWKQLNPLLRHTFDLGLKKR